MTTPSTPPPAGDGSGGAVPTCYRHPGREAHIHCQRCDKIICPDCMRPAAVGFQCPECVKQGARTTRSGRTAYGGLRPSDASVTSMVLIGVNVVVWIAIIATGGYSSKLFENFVLSPRRIAVPGGTVPGVADGAYWELVTSMFTHVAILHIGFNMFALYILGPQLELAIGRSRFLALYFLSGLAGSALVYWGGRGAYGASGAVFGLMGALLILAIKARGDVRGVLTWIGINFVFTFVFVNAISWEGHVGGFVGGTAIGAILFYAPRGPRRTTVQVAGLSAVAALVAVAIALRSLTIS